MLIEGSVEPRMRRGEEEESASGFQEVEDIFQGFLILFDMFEDVKADDRINMIGPITFHLWAGDVEVLDYKFLIFSKGFLQKGEVFWLHIGGNDEISIQKKFGDVSNP